MHGCIVHKYSSVYRTGLSHKAEKLYILTADLSRKMVNKQQTRISIFRCSSKGLLDDLTTNHNKAAVVRGLLVIQSRYHAMPIGYIRAQLSVATLLSTIMGMPNHVIHVWTVSGLEDLTFGTFYRFTNNDYPSASEIFV